MRGAASRDFKWARFHSTSMLHSVHFLGSAGEWRHSWQYDLLEKPADGGARPELELLLPTGHARIFRPNATGWAPLSAYKESIAAVGDGYEITTGSGAKLRFVRVGGKLQMQSLTDAHGLITRLDYDAQGTLAKVTDPAGHFLALAYRDVPLQRGRVTDSAGWVDSDYLGIDQGPIVAMIENHRSGLVWEHMRGEPAIRTGLKRAGFTGGWLG